MNLLYKIAKYKAIISLAFVFALGLVLSPSLVNGQGYNPNDPLGVDELTTPSDGSTGLALGSKDLRTTAVSIINIALSLLGIIAVVVILIGGFQWMTAGGDDGKVETARKWIFSGIIGLAIILSAWAIARFALTNLASATDTTNVYDAAS